MSTDFKEVNEEILAQNPKELKGKERDNWLTEKQKDVMNKVINYAPSEEDLMEMLTFMSKFHNYSYKNSMLIEAQWEGATAVASSQRWKKLGYYIRKGETGKILIWIRVKYKRIKLDEGWIPWSKAPKQVQKDALAGKYEWTESVSYKSGYVYDITQTTAEIEDYPKLMPNRHYNFEENNVDYQNLLGGIDILANKLGYEMEWDERGVLHSAKGGCVYETKQILLNKRNTHTENVSTSIHELAHAYLHSKSELDRGERELQAELVATVVSSVFGIDTREKAVGYISAWMKSADKRLKEDGKEMQLEDLLQEVQKTVKTFVRTINGEMDYQDGNDKAMDN
ncbi:ImmA/IrrE family metallo-endopeptidase [Bacillus cereus]|nr:ImmA/IrrE family metallo-endopeptidase [Bacillus cereus]